MLFSQYIYTSWNNGDSPDKGFMIYGKSDDVGMDEAGEILNTMRYRPHRSLPDMPSAFEIVKVFPKNFAVFPLRSGRICIAQATYVGRDYVKEENPRFGNYIIHAFLVNPKEGVCLQNLMRLPLFKSALTSAEQDAPAGPHLLDRIEITEDELCAGDPPEIPDDDSFWTTLQAVLLAIPERKNVYVTTEQEQVEDWVKALIDLLPASIAAKLTLSTYLLNKNPQLTLNFIHRESPTFRPAEEAMNPNSYVIHQFDSRYNSNILPGRYVTALRDTWKWKGALAAIDYRAQIERWMRLFSLPDVDAAVELEDFFSENPCFCQDAENIRRILDRYDGADESLRRRMYDQTISILERFGDGYGDAQYPLYRRIYPYLPDSICRTVREKISLHLLDTSSDVSELLKAYHHYAQMFGADSKAVMETQLWNMIEYPKAQRIATTYCSQNFKTVTHPDLIDWYSTGVRNRLLHMSAACEVQQFEAAMKEYIAVCAAGRHPLDGLLADLSDSDCWTNPSIAFYLLDMASDRLDLYIQCMDRILLSYDGTSPALIEKLEKSMQRSACMRGKKIDDYLGDSHPEYIKERNRIKAMETAETSRQRLCQYYQDYVAYENGDGREKLEREFHRLLQSYFQNAPSEKRSKEAIAIYEFLASLEDPRSIAANPMMILYRNAFDNVTLDQLIQWKVSAKTVDELNVEAERYGIPNAPVALIYQDYCFFKQCYGLIKNRVGDLQGILWENEFYYRYPGCPANLRHDFMMRTFPLMMQCTVGTVAPLDYPAILTHLLACFASDRTFTGTYLDYLQSLASFGPVHLILLTYCAESEDQFADFLNRSVLLPYLKKLAKGDREVLFAYWLKHSEDRSAAEAYIRTYQENHRSLWDKLFSKKKADQPQEDDTDTLN